VGEQGDSGSTAAGVAAQRAAYDETAQSWAGGPGQFYGVLASELVRSAAVPVTGRVVLDLGAGTGAAGQAALDAGAQRVAAADPALGMLRQCGDALHPVAADGAALPFRDNAFDLVLAAFSLSHLISIQAGLREVRRVGDALAASAFAPGWTHPAKAAVDQALSSFGYRPPEWYVRFKTQTEPAADDPDRLAAEAATAGFADVRVRTIAVPTGLSTPAQLVSWRLGMAHVAPFVRSLDPDRRAAARRAAERAVAGSGPLVVSMMVLTAS
jgi:ubiquinone/menaquinone biosynthesis C-methylase UbiE